MSKAPAPAKSPTASFLTADFGNVNTRVVLVDVVEGRYRLVARSTSETTLDYPFNDVSVGLGRILSHIGSVTGRELMNADGQLITPEDSHRRGVDYFLATATAGRPLRAIVVGVLPEVSLASALRAVASTYVEPVGYFHIKDGLSDEERLNVLLRQLPDLIFITGGTDGGASQALRHMMGVVRLGLQILDPTRRPLLLYAGNKALVAWMQTTFEGISNVLVADNIRPSMNSEALDTVLTRLAQAYEQHKEQYSAPYKRVSAMSASGVQPSALSYSLIIEYLARMRRENVLMLDMGSATTTVIGAFNGDIDTNINTTMGLGHHAPNLIEQVGGADVVRAWLPFEISRLELANYALNKRLRPATVPMTPRDVYIEHGLLRAGLRHAIAQARPTWRGVAREGLLPPMGLVIVAGAPLTQTGNPALTMQLVADIVQPVGITEIKADANALIAGIGAIARMNAHAVVQLLDGNNLDHLGTLISAQGNLKAGKPALKLKITTQDGEVYDHTLLGGEMWLLPLPTGRELAIDMRCVRGVSIHKQRRIKRTFYGGSGGILFDMRSRPLAVGLTPGERAQNMPLWLEQATGEAMEGIPEGWLEPVEEQEDIIMISASDEEDDEQQHRKDRKKNRKKDKQATQTMTEVGADDEADFEALLDAEGDEQDELDDLRKML